MAAKVADNGKGDGAVNSSDEGYAKAGAGEQGKKAGTGKAANAPKGMHAAHQSAAVKLLYDDSVSVHHYLGCTHAGTKKAEGNSI